MAEEMLYDSESMRQFGYVKIRYRGLAKSHVQLFTLFALGNLFLMRRKLMG